MLEHWNVKNKKKIPEIIFPIVGIGLIYLSFKFATSLNLPGSYLCPEKIGICAAPLLGKAIAGFSNPTFWVGIIFYAIVAVGLLFTLHKRGYKI